MGTETKIQWADHTLNVVRGCARISPGCDNCYAEAMAKRNPAVLGTWGPGGTRTHAAESYWGHLEKWNTAAERAGRVALVFCNSLADMFEGAHVQAPDGTWTEIPGSVRADYLPVLDRLARTTARLPWLRLLMLSKRPWNQLAWSKANGWPETWWAGTTTENQATADHRIPFLLDVPAAVRFLSVEPMLGPVTTRGWLTRYMPPKFAGQTRHPNGLARAWHGIDWAIVGGESGPHARPMHPDWARTLRDECAVAGIPFHMKQWGVWAPGENFPDHIPSGHSYNLEGYTPPGIANPVAEDRRMWRMDKHLAGNALDGVVHDARPPTALPC